MGFKNDVTYRQKKEFLDRIIYPEQFSSDRSLIFHVYNVCYGLMNGSTTKIKNTVKMYLPNTAEHIIDKHLEAISSKYIAEKSDSRIRRDCFTCITEELVDEDMYFGDKKHRKVMLAEYKFIIHRVTVKAYKMGKPVTLASNYFLGSDLKEQYRKYTSKALSPHKLTHIWQVLQKYNYLHITSNNKNTHVFQIGNKNPFYILQGVPEVDEQLVQTRSDRKIVHLLEQVNMLQSANQMLKEEVEQVKTENITLQQEKNQLVEMVEERDEEIEQIKVAQIT